MIHETTCYAGEFLLSEGNGNISREEITVNATAGKLIAGTVMAKITSANAATPTAGGSNTGNGSIGTVTVASAATTGTYLLKITAAATNGGAFSVTGPNGETVGTGSVGVAFNHGGLSFTLADGSTDFAVNDTISIAVNAGLGEYVPYDDDGTNDGRRTASGVLYAPVDASTTDAKAVIIARHAEVDGAMLTGLDDAAKADLLTLDIIVR